MCRYCKSAIGKIVLDLGEQPASEYFPSVTDQGPDRMAPLRLWLCAECGLAQLADDADLPEKPEGREPEALVRQRRDAVAQLWAAGLLQPGSTVAEGATPHGGTWLPNLGELGLRPVAGSDVADVFVDGVFGMMHAADQSAALDASLARLAPDGLLLFQFHSLAAIVGGDQWNAVRHGHYAYYSTPVVRRMLADRGLVMTHAWTFPLYGGTVLVAARRATGAPSVDASVDTTVATEIAAGVLDADVVAGLQRAVDTSTAALRSLLDTCSDRGQVVYGYSAASRAVALLHMAGIGRDRLPGVADASPGKHGCRMPGTDVPVVSPSELVTAAPDLAILFVPDLLPEVRAALPEIEQRGGRWVDAGALDLSLPSRNATSFANE